MNYAPAICPVITYFLIIIPKSFAFALVPIFYYKECLSLHRVTSPFKKKIRLKS